MRPFGTAPMERSRWILALGPSFWAGCFAASFFQPGAWPWALAAAGAGLFLLTRRAGRKGFAGLMLCAAALGLLWTMPRLEPAAPQPGTYEEITGYVYGEPKLRSDSRLTFTLTDVRLDGQPVSGRAYCSLFTGRRSRRNYTTARSCDFRGGSIIRAAKAARPGLIFVNGC